MEPKFNETATKEEIVETIQAWVKESRPYHDELLRAQQKCLKYYRGNQTDRDEIPPYNSNTVYNRIFEGTETLVPIVTGTAQQFIAIPGEDSEVAIKNAQALQKVLTRKYTDLEIQKKLEVSVRDVLLKRFGVLEWGWDIETDDLGVWVQDPRLVLIPRLRSDAHDLPYAMLIEEYDYQELTDNFPDVKPDDLKKGKQLSQVDTGNPKNSEEIYQVLRVMTKDYWVWVQENTILKRMVNPYYDYKGEEVATRETRPNGKIRKRSYRRFFNHLDKPMIPFVYFTPFTTGEAPVSEISLAEVVIPIQDDINTQKRQIVNNLVRMGNGQVYVDANSLPQEIIDQISSEPGLVLVGTNLASENRIRREPGVSLPSSHFANLQASLAAFDNVYGTHGSLRGAGGDSKTLGGQVINRQQDLSRVDQITREVNRGLNRLVDGLTQLMKMFYDTAHVIPLIGRDGSIEFLRFTRNNIDDGVILETKSGAPVLLDPIARSNRAVQLWQLGAIDPEMMFEEMDFPDPQTAAKKLASWKTGQLLLESDLRIKEAANAVAQKQAADAASAASAPPNRKAETPNDARSRAEAGMSQGGKSSLPGNIKV